MFPHFRITGKHPIAENPILDNLKALYKSLRPREAAARKDKKLARRAYPVVDHDKVKAFVETEDSARDVKNYVWALRDAIAPALDKARFGSQFD